jgi:hypothetical protein
MLRAFILFFLFLSHAFCQSNERERHKLDGWQFEFLRIYQEPPQWMLDQIHEDLASVLPSEISSVALNRFMEQYAAGDQRWCLARIVIRNNHVLVQKCIPGDSCEEGFRRVRLDWMLKGIARLAECVTLPNVDMIICLLDALDLTTPIPIFVYAKNPHLAPKCILIPDFEALAGNKNFVNDVYAGNQRYPWSQKKNLAIFRGSMTGGDFNKNTFLNFPRSKTVALSLQFPYIINARFTDLPQWDGWGRFRDFFSQGLSVEEHVEYKYQLLIDGHSCAYSRAYWQMFSNCVIFKQTSENIQWYYRALQPFVHYIPVHWDMSDLVEMIFWAIDHDEEAEQISNRAQDFAKNNLTYAKVMQYLYHLLVEYAKLQNN